MAHPDIEGHAGNVRGNTSVDQGDVGDVVSKLPQEEEGSGLPTMPILPVSPVMRVNGSLESNLNVSSRTSSPDSPRRVVNDLQLLLRSTADRMSLRQKLYREKMDNNSSSISYSPSRESEGSDSLIFEVTREISHLWKRTLMILVDANTKLPIGAFDKASCVNEFQNLRQSVDNAKAALVNGSGVENEDKVMLEAEMALLSGQVDIIHDIIDRMTVSSNVSEEERTQWEVVFRQLEERQERIEMLTSENSDLHQRVSQLEEVDDDGLSPGRTVRDQNKEFKAQLEDLERQKEEAQQKSRADVRAKLELKEENEYLQKTVSNLNSLLEEEKERTRHLSEKREAEQEEMAGLQKQLSEVRKDLVESEEAKGNLQDKLMQQESAVSELRTLVESADASVSLLKEERKSLKEKLFEKEQLRLVSNDCRRMVELELSISQSRLNEEMKIRLDFQKTCEFLEQEKLSLEAALSEKSKAVEDTSSFVERQTQEKRDLQKTIEELNTKLAAAEEQLQSVEGAATESQSFLMSKEKELLDSKKSVKRLQDELKGVSSNLEVEKRRSRELEEWNWKASEELSMWKDMLHAEQQARQSLEKSRGIMEKKLSNFHASSRRPNRPSSPTISASSSGHRSFQPRSDSVPIGRDGKDESSSRVASFRDRAESDKYATGASFSYLKELRQAASTANGDEPAEATEQGAPTTHAEVHRNEIDKAHSRLDKGLKARKNFNSLQKWVDKKSGDVRSMLSEANCSPSDFKSLKGEVKFNIQSELSELAARLEQEWNDSYDYVISQSLMALKVKEMQDIVARGIADKETQNMHSAMEKELLESRTSAVELKKKVWLDSAVKHFLDEFGAVSKEFDISVTLDERRGSLLEELSKELGESC